MRPKLINAILLLITLSLWIGVLGIRVFEIGVAIFPNINRENMVVDGLVYKFVIAGFHLSLAIFISRLFRKIEKLDVPVLMWRLFMVGMVGVVIIMLITFLNRLQLFNSLGKYFAELYLMLGYLAVLVFFLSATFIYRRFIFYPRTKRKIQLWRIFLSLLGLALLMETEVINRLVGNANLMPTIRVIGFIVFLATTIILSSNVRWSAYLNFSQKIRVLGLLGLIALVIATFIIAIVRLPGQLSIQNPPNDSSFVFMLIVFSISYTLFAILFLFFNLPTTSVFERESVEIASFSNINQAIQSNLDDSEILRNLLNGSIMASNADAGWIELIDRDTGQILVKQEEGIRESERDQLNRGHQFTHQVIETKAPFLVQNIKRHRSFRGYEGSYKCMLVIPILSNSQNYGAVFVVNELASSIEDVTEDSLKAFAEQAGIALENAELIKESIEVERYKEQLKIAKEVQDQLLPSNSSLPRNNDVEFIARSETAQEVGGDYYDVSQPRDDVYRVAIGDVSGKGTTAAFYMAEIKGIFHALTYLDMDVKNFIINANRALSKCMQHGFFMSLSYLEICAEDKTVELVRAGHCPTFHYKASEDKIQMLREGTLGLGIVRNESYSNYVKDIHKFEYGSGDFLVLYTDGILEARNEKGEEYGYERLESEISRGKDGDAEEMAASIIRSVKSFSHSKLDDDYTLLIIRFP
ncbi:MAG: SpoIIE family protein phosphatase [Bacteroidia bacterium]|nr:SpoIIE family protein phosphatase [Bacteroidia bacterium]